MPGPMRKPIAEVFARWYVVVPDGCFIWVGARNQVSGYGQFNTDDGIKAAHRVSYELAKGPIPAGLQLDHLCRRRECVRPEHLEAVTQRVNTLRSTAPTARNAVATHCVRGHEFTDDNTLRRTTGSKGRECRRCITERSRERRQRIRQEGAR
jgi:hypothetical protein